MTTPCDGCGKLGDCAHVGQEAPGGAWLGYRCGCLSAFTKSTTPWTKAAEWARARRAGRAA